MDKLFENKIGDSDLNLHPKYKILRDLPLHKKVLEMWFRGFKDRDNKIIKEFQTTFHSSFWEIYLFAVLKELKYKFDMSNPRPDFILEFNYEKVLIEATTANIKKRGIPEESRDMSNFLNMFTPPYQQKNFEYEVNESIVRYSNAINSKLKLYQTNYKKCDWISDKDPYVIALSSYSQVDYGREYIYGIIALLFGVYFKHEEMKYKYKETIIKNGTEAEIELGLFYKEAYKNISAVIFSCTTTIGKITATVLSENENYDTNKVYCLYQDLEDSKVPYKLNIVTTDTPEFLQDGLFVIHNPGAKNPLNLNYFNNPAITQIFVNDKGIIEFIGNLCPTVARLDIPAVLANILEERILSQVAAFNCI
ncbi:hypothetical protein ABEI56_05030 [Peribacillus castrilensis]|uniref:hypothetical protein n=1 Tax=Peribacillus TaxID=2675229 RepID=UPI003871DA31